jgi:Ca2+-binding EF-hand superfamily protein/Ran GTPase-activating protein (RanGAP) involved in mRNA processing and transport
MLDAQLKNPQRFQSPTKALGLSDSRVQGHTSRVQFSFAPLRDPKMLTETAHVMMTPDLDSDGDGGQSDDDQDEEIGHSEHVSYGANPAMYGDQNSSQPDEDDKDHTAHKYFGAAAKEDYYRTYRELHGKTHLFVQVTRPQVSGLRSSSSCPTTLDNNSFALPVISPSKSGGKRRHTRHRHVPPLESQSEGSNPPNEAASGHGSMLSTHSPRVLFLASCLAKSRPALALVLRKAHSRAFDFSHQGLGDDFIVDFAACLPEIPLVEAINVSDNSLSDHAIDALLHALENKPNLTYLNISGNGVGSKSAASLRVYIASSLCTLKTLVLDDAEVDDAECALFMMSFEGNKSVEVLSLRSNTIGQPQLQQSLNWRGARSSSPAKVRSADSESTTAGTGQPTGGEAIGSMLNVNLTIQHLDLSWNSLRAITAIPIASALQLNYHLRELTLTHNNIGDSGAIAFGQSLRSNSTLQKLRLEYNAIGSKGALGLSSGLAVNITLLELSLDGNPIGREAAKALMRASCSRPSTSTSGSAFCRLSLMECNLTNTTAGAKKNQKKRHATSVNATDTTTTLNQQLVVFDPNSPAGSYVLNLAEPYENVVAHELVRLASDEVGSSEFRLTRIEFTPVPVGSSKPASVKLEHVKVSKKADNAQNATESVVPSGSDEAISASRTQRHRSKSAVAMLFQQVDTDGSGCVDQLELLQAMRAHGISVPDADLSRLLREYDYDNSGSLQAHEFADLFFRCGFAMIDSDGSGSLDRREVSRVLSLMGINDVSEAEIAGMLARYDLDNSGEIDEQEFLAFLKAEILGNNDADGSEGDGDANPSPIVTQWVIRDSANAVAYTIGTSGTLMLELVHDPMSTDDDDGSKNRSRLGRRISDAFVSKLLTNVQGISKNLTEQREFLHLVLKESELLFSYQQALALLAKQAGSMKTQRRRLDGVCRLLPQMASRQDAANLVAQLVDSKDQWLERFALRSRLGQWFPVLLGSLTNAYTFNLGNDIDRAALKRLAQLSQGEKLFSKNRSGRSDTSQHGDWENFRNALVNGKPVLLTSTFILNSLLGPSSPLPSSLGPIGAATSHNKTIVSFHYVSTQRPPRGTQPLSRRRFDQLQRVLQFQLPPTDDVRSFIGKVWADNVERDLTIEEEEAKQRARMHWDILRRSVLKRCENFTAADAMSNQQVMVEQLRGSLEQVQNRLALLEMLVADRWVSCEQALEVIATFPNALHARAKAACVLFSRVIDLHNFIQVRQALTKAHTDQATNVLYRLSDLRCAVTRGSARMCPATWLAQRLRSVPTRSGLPAAGPGRARGA